MGQGPTFLIMVVARGADGAERHQRAAGALAKLNVCLVDAALPGVWEVRAPVNTRDVAHAIRGVLGPEDEVRFFVPIRRGELATYRVAGGAL